VLPPAQGQPAPIDTIALEVNELYVLLTATEAAIKGGSAPPTSDVPNKINVTAGRMPQPVRSMLATLSTSGAGMAWDLMRTTFSQSLQTISDFCKKAIDNRYPFSRKSASDTTSSDFARLFSPGGLLDDFFQKNLAQHVDTSTRPWTFRKSAGAGKASTSSGLQEFRRAQIIRDVFFAGGGRTAEISLVFKPLDMDDSITQFILDVDGKFVKYDHGPRVSTNLQWPGPSGSSRVQLQIFPESTDGLSFQLFEGPWALFRMFDSVEVKPTPQPEKFRATFNMGGRKASFEVTFSSVQNPFRLKELEQFNCPERL
jgi:type VI secretion system protein ImpL